MKKIVVTQSTIVGNRIVNPGEYDVPATLSEAVAQQILSAGFGQEMLDDAASPDPAPEAIPVADVAPAPDAPAAQAKQEPVPSEPVKKKKGWR
jgi:hypothetical protein